MQFVADAMLGRLARWMRTIGCDVAYYRDIKDRDLTDIAQRENRMILTRDTLLIKRKRVRGNAFFVEGDSYKDQLRQVVLTFSIDPYQNLLTRCIECNVRLEDIDREKVVGSLPEYVSKSQDFFRTCLRCSRIYWPATHKDSIMKTLHEIFGE